MTTTKKINRFANYGTLEKLARRYTTLWKSYLNRSTEDRSPKAEAEAEERAKIREQVKKLTNHNLGFEIIKSWEDFSDYCYAECYHFDDFRFLLGLITALGFRKVAVRVLECDADKAIYEAHQYGWNCTSTGVKGGTTTYLRFENKRLTDNN